MPAGHSVAYKYIFCHFKNPPEKTACGSKNGAGGALGKVGISVSWVGVKRTLSVG